MLHILLRLKPHISSFYFFNLQVTLGFFVVVILLFFKDFIYLFLERREGREKKKERNINVWLPLKHPTLGTWPTIQECALTGNRTGDLLVHRPKLNPLSYISQGHTSLLNRPLGALLNLGARSHKMGINSVHLSELWLYLN